MKIQEAKIEFVAFDAQDVITTSGGDGFYFVMNEFTAPANWTTSTFVAFQSTDAGITRTLFSHTSTGVPYGADLSKAYQLVCEKNSINKVDKVSDSAYTAHVVAAPVDNASGTQIMTWEGILNWIAQYGQ